MKKRALTPITYLYTFIVFGLFAVWAYDVEKESGVIDPKDHQTTLIIFVAFMIVGLILAGIDFSSEKEKGNKITRKSVITGVTIALLFLVWRVFMSLV